MTFEDKEKYLHAGFEVAKRLAHAGYNLERPACTLTWGQIARELSRVLVDLGIQPDQVSDETLCDLVEGVKETSRTCTGENSSASASPRWSVTFRKARNRTKAFSAKSMKTPPGWAMRRVTGSMAVPPPISLTIFSCYGETQDRNRPASHLSRITLPQITIFQTR